MMRLPVLVCVSTMTLLAVSAAPAAEKRFAPDASHASSQPLPDWAGWWHLSIPSIAELQRQPAPMRKDDLARFQLRTENQASDPLRWCRPVQFVGHSGGFVEDVEFLFTPGRVTLTNESGMIRRIYTDGRAIPENVEATDTGTSTGHWEGETLVVETTAINPEARFPDRGPGSLPIGKNVRILERIALKDKDTLQFDVTLIAPDMLTAPDSRRRLYARSHKQLPREVSFCVNFDRSIDPITGEQRFDTTPPKDLPPPPPITEPHHR